MRLNTDQVRSIRLAATEAFGAGVKVWVFGSRADDGRKGGDIDLLIRPDPGAAGPSFARKIRMLSLLERALGERKVDLVIEQDQDSRPIVAIARESGIQIQ